MAAQAAIDAWIVMRAVRELLGSRIDPDARRGHPSNDALRPEWKREKRDLIAGLLQIIERERVSRRAELACHDDPAIVVAHVGKLCRSKRRQHILDFRSAASAE
jgi:hypothetical protein